MLITRKKGAFHSIQFEVDLTKYGKTGADVSDITFSVKEKLTDDDSAIFLKRYLLGGITFSGTTILEVFVNWSETEYDNFELDKIYKAGLFITFTGDPSADENVDDIYEIKIVQDYLRL